MKYPVVKRFLELPRQRKFVEVADGTSYTDAIMNNRLFYRHAVMNQSYAKGVLEGIQVPCSDSGCGLLNLKFTDFAVLNYKLSPPLGETFHPR